MPRPVLGLLPIILFLGAVSPSFGQAVLQPGTALRIGPSTTVTLAGQTVLATTPGSVITNDGTIVVGESASVSEASGAAIRGAGSERYSTTYASPLNQIGPGGLGLTVTTAIAPGAMELRRWHTPVVEPGGAQSIARWYDWSSAVNTGLDAEVRFGYDDQELNGIPETDQVLHVLQANSFWLAVPSGVDAANDRVTASGLDSLGVLTTFSGALTTSTASLNGLSEPYLFPTLAEEQVYVILPANMPLRRLLLHDAQGRQVALQVPVQAGRSTTVHVSELAPGMYTLTINDRHVCRFIRP